MKRILSAILIITMLFCACAQGGVSAHAQEMPLAQTCAAELEALGVDLQAFEQTVRAGLEQCQQEIDIFPFRVPRNDGNYNLQLIAEYIRNYLPEYFHLTYISANATKQYYYHLICEYDERFDTPEAFTEEKAYIDAIVDTMLLGVEGNEALSQAEQALLVHDRLIDYVAYDMHVYEGTDIPDDSYTVYGVFCNRIAVCEGYSKAYSYMLNRIGIHTIIVTSNALEHAWNMVYIEGIPYYVDCTWDDPVLSYEGTVKHNNFLRSLNGIISSGHITADGTVDYADEAVSDTTYDSGCYWQTSVTQVMMIENRFYYIDQENALLKCANDGATLCSVDDVWRVDTTHYFSGNFSKLSAIGNALFFSKSDGVYRYDIRSGKVKKIFTPDASSFGEYYNVYGFRCEGRTFYCYLSNDANCDYTTVNDYLLMHEYAHYDVTISCDASQGEAYVDGETDELADVLLTAVNKPGYTFKGFYLNGKKLTDTDTDNNRKTVWYEVKGNVTIQAQFNVCSHTSATQTVVEPTCTQEGYTSRVCTTCGWEQKSNIQPALGHDYSIEQRNANTLRTPAQTGRVATYYYTCLHCNTCSVEEDLYFYDLLSATLIGKVDPAMIYKGVEVEVFTLGVSVMSTVIEPGGTGEFTLNGLSAGSFTLVLKGDALAGTQVKNITLRSGRTNDLRNSMLIGVRTIWSALGDVNGDRMVDISDISVLLNSENYAQLVSDAVEDIDGSGCIDMGDIRIMLLAKNYGCGEHVFSF